MNKNDLQNLIPRDKFDIERAQPPSKPDFPLSSRFCWKMLW